MGLQKGEAVLPHMAKGEETHGESETETEKNTRLNSSLYNQSCDSIHLYKQQNDSSDLLGRLYYDEYDSDVMSSENSTPILSPVEDEDFHFNSTPRPQLNRLNSFERGISFDTTPHGTAKSLTLKVKSSQFKFRRNNKTWLVGYNNDYESQKAIEWLFDEMIINGDTIVILEVLDPKVNESIDRKTANVLLMKFEKLNVHNKKISLIFEIIIGKPLKILKRAIDEYSPSMMVIGTHHYSMEKEKHKKGILSTSLSKHFLECALIPVIIVKPTYNYVEYLTHPIDNNDYFANWIRKTSGDEIKHKKNGFLSPSHSRNSSYTNLVQEERGRRHPELLKVATTESRSRSSSRSKLGRFFKS